MGNYSAFRSRFFVIANNVKQSIEPLYNRNDKKSSTQVGLQISHPNLICPSIESLNKYSYITISYSHDVKQYSRIVIQYSYDVAEYSYNVTEYSRVVTEYSCIVTSYSCDVVEYFCIVTEYSYNVIGYSCNCKQYSTTSSESSSSPQYKLKPPITRELQTTQPTNCQTQIDSQHKSPKTE